MKTIYANDVGLIKLGYQSENDRTEVIFDVSDIAEEFPGGLISVAVRRPTDSAGHLVTSITQNGSTARWLVDDYELEHKGIGKLQLVYSVKGVVAKTKIWSIAINESIIASDTIPEPPQWMDILNSLLEAAGEVHQVVESYDAMTAEAKTIDSDSEATAEIDHSGNNPILRIGIPRCHDADAATRKRVFPLTNTEITKYTTLEVIGNPPYVNDADLAQYAEYGITDSGWYLFARIMAENGVVVSEETSVEGAKAIITAGADHVDIAVFFDVAAVSQKIVIHWSESNTETFVFKATDLAVRNLDYRTTFYVYDLTPYVTWEYTLTTDTTFVAGHRYYVLSNETYIEAVEGTDWTVGETIPADTYYKHSKLKIAGMIRNVTYEFDELVDCGIEIALPDIEDNGYGAWFEFQFRHTASGSITMVPVSEDVKTATAGASASITAGVNVVDLHYTHLHDTKLWTLANVHTNIPS